MAGEKIPLNFRIYKGEQLLREETLTQPVIKVGKLSSSHLRLDDESVSRMHAVIEVSGPDDISIIDLGSTKGTVVNGQKVNKAKLQGGDLIALGDIRIEFTLGTPEAGDEDVTSVNTAALPPEPASPTDSGVIASVDRPAPPASPPPAPPAQGGGFGGAVASGVGAAAAGAAVAGAAFGGSGGPGGSAVPPPPGTAAPPPPPSAPPVGGASAPPPSFGLDAVDDMGGARAIEVAAMLGDSVVGVKHVMNPRGGKVTSATYGLFGIGALLLVLAAISFFIGVGNAAENKARLKHWTEVEKRPIHEFRPKRISLAYDWMAFGGALGGLFCVTLGLVRFRNEKVEPYFRIGRASGVDFPTDDAPVESFPLVAPVGDDFAFNFTPQMSGEMILDGQSTALSELQGQGRARPSQSAPGALEVPVPPKARFRITSGTQTFLVSSVPQPRKQAAPLLAGLETSVLAFFGGSALVHFGFLALLFSIPPDPKALSLDNLGADGRLARVQNKPQEDPKNEEEELEDGADEKSGGTGTKMALTEGKMGKKESTRQSGQYAMKNNDADPQLAKQKAVDNARKAGVLGLLQQKPGGAFASLTGTGDFSSGLDDRDVYGGLIGNEVGEMAGGWGYGLSGVGPGGGGTGWGTIGTGNYGTIGHGSGTGSGYGTGSGSGGMRGRKARPPQVRIGNASATGDLDKNIIRRYIRRRLAQIKNCYEKQLMVKPHLRGTVVSQFQISPNGTVQGSSASGVDGTVSSCVAGVVGRIKFPKPRGGGYVNVRYPFHFR